MNNYYFIGYKVDDDNNHALHTYGCPLLPSYHYREYLGYFSSTISALDKAEMMGVTSITRCPKCCE